MAEKLKDEHKHILRLISRDAAQDGWAVVGKQLYPVLSKNMPEKLVTFEMVGDAGRARLTDEGMNVMRAMDWL